MEMTALVGLGIAAGVLAVATALGLWLRRRDGRMRSVAGASTDVNEPGAPAPADAALLATLGVSGAAQATLLQFSSAFCAPCRATRRICADVAELIDGVEHVEVDAESHLEAVRQLRVWRTPTVLVIDGAGRIAGRASGQPTRAQVIAAVGALLPIDAGAVRP